MFKRELQYTFNLRFVDRMMKLKNKSRDKRSERERERESEGAIISTEVVDITGWTWKRRHASVTIHPIGNCVI